MNIENVSSIGVTLGRGFLAGILIGYALKKVMKTVAVVVGLYQQILNINWNKLQVVSQNTLSTLANATAKIPGLGSNAHNTASLALTNIGIPLTGSISMGFAIGFIRG